MSSLVLIRHGQASFGAQDYDQLSELGKEQAKAVGRLWARNRSSFDQWITGPRKRQKQTTSCALQSYQCGGMKAPPLREDPAFDEHQLEDLLRHHRHALPLGAVKEWEKQRAGLAAGLELQRGFYHLLLAVAQHWVLGGEGTAVVEPWTQFKNRVLGGLSRILQQQGHGRRVAIFTSAGVIGVAMQRALGCDDVQAMELSFRLRNASLTEFLFSGSRFTLESFNGLPHLPDQREWTHL